MNKFTLNSLFILLNLVSVAQVGNRRIHNEKNPYRDSYQRVSCGGAHTLEIRNGALWAYGNNFYGQLGDGTTTNENTPEEIGSATNWMMLSAGGEHSLGIESNGTLWAWGWNSFGQLGDGTNTDAHSPEQIGADTTWISISAGDAHTLALKANGTLWAWGANDSGQLGDGTTINKNVPQQIGSANNWVTISAGARRSFAIRSDGTLWAWGKNTNGYLGDGTTTNHSAPVQIGTGNNWVSVSAGFAHTLALQANGTLWAWGDNSTGELGNGTTDSAMAPIQVGNSYNWVQAVAGDGFSLAVMADGSLWAWGYNSTGALGDGTNINENSPEQIAGSNKWEAVAAGDYHAFALSANGLLNGWGENVLGQLGNGMNTNTNLPAVISSVVNWVKIAPGANHTLALRSDGTLWGWGNNNEGDIGDSTEKTRLSPVEVYGNAVWVNCEAGVDFSLGIQQDGTLWAWGDNYYGQLGDGNSGGSAYQIAPEEISATNDWVSVTAGGVHSMALKADGTLWTWGNNSYGELGRSSGNLLIPGQMGTDSNWTRFESGTGTGSPIDHSLAIQANGTLWAWGANTAGQLGIGINNNETVPVQVGTDSTWASASGGQGFTEAIKTDGTLWGWGGNGYGQVGNGGNVNNDYYSPVLIDSGVNNWINVTTGTLHAVGLRSDGSLWEWGYNFSGQLGNGSTGDENVPVNTIPPKGWGDLGGGSEANSAIALEPDRLSYCATGVGYGGMLGDGYTASRDTYGCTQLILNFPPVAKFIANPLTICAGSDVTFTDQSTGTPTGWKWIFTGGAPDSSSAKSQVVVYDSVGIYNAELIVTNAYGSDTIYKTDYITVISSPVVTVAPKDTSVCAGSPVTLSARGATSYTWSPLAGLNDTTGSMVTATLDSTTTYSVIGSNGGCSDTTSLAISIKPLPVAGIISSPVDSICAGTPVSLFLTNSSGSIQWQSSPDEISFNNTGDTTAAYTADSISQTTSYRVLASNSCGADTSAMFKITVNPLPAPVVFTNDSLICSDDSSEIQTTGNYSTYFWNDGDTRPYTFATAAGGYWVTVTDANGCSGTSNHVNIKVYPVPSVSLVVKGDTLSSYGAVTYQWYKNGELLAGDTSAVYIAGDSGQYTLLITDTNGCKAISNPVYVVPTGVGELSAGNSFDVYPNPFGNFIFIQPTNTNMQIQQVKIYDLPGRLMLSEQPGNRSSALTEDVSQLSAGVYFINVVANEIGYTFKMVKINSR